MSRVPTDGTDKKKLDKDMPVLAITLNMANTVISEQKQESWENYEEPTKKEFNPYLPELWAPVDLVDETESNILDICKFIEAQFVDPVCCQAFTSMGERSSSIAYDTGRVLVRLYWLGGAPND